MNRIQETFKRLEQEGRKSLVAFVTGGYPNFKDSLLIIEEICKNGADILELGLPYSDPLADGVVIEKSYEEAIRAGIGVEEIFKLIRKIRSFSNIPIVIMSYYNPVYCYGVEKFNREFRESGGDGLIIPDLPLEEREAMLKECKKVGLDLIPLVAPTSDERIERIVENASGFIYCVSVNGITGERGELSDNLDQYLKLVKSKTNLPALVGFGISNGQTIDRLKNLSDGVIIGSAIVKRIKKDTSGYTEIGSFIREMKSHL